MGKLKHVDAMITVPLGPQSIPWKFPRMALAVKLPHTSAVPFKIGYIIRNDRKRSAQEMHSSY